RGGKRLLSITTKTSDRSMVDTVQPQGLLSCRNGSASSLLIKMQVPRWNNCKNPRTKGKTAQPSISHSGEGLEGKKSSTLPGEGGIFSLTFPFIDQAFALRTLVVSAKAIQRHLT